ncbi:MAG: B12-binding domain-containing radical SAM protein [Chloroflexota bacterium]|nr:MAG: B12-binding domain-containing radical SAM protein [Chloroflexota bacterium]
MNTLASVRRVLIVIPPLVNSESEPTALNIDRPDFESYRLVSPVEPTSVAGDLLQRGFDVELFDLGTYMTGRFEALQACLRNTKPDAVVIVQSILTFATAQDWDGRKVFDIARQEVSGVLTVLTGGQPTNYPGQAVTAGVCDYSIRGEVDFAVGELLIALNERRELNQIDGLAFRDSAGEVHISEKYPSVDIAALPMPAYQLIGHEQKEKYASTLERGKIRYPARNTRYRDIMTSRSCRLRCAFCSVAALRGDAQHYRRKPLERVVAEIESALEDGIGEIHFFDDLFAESEEQIIAFANELVRRNLKFPWFAAQGMPLWPLTQSALAAMKEAGMYRIICPLESGNDRVLKRVIGKAYSTTKHHHDVLEWSHGLGLEIIGMYVLGMPGETRHDIYETMQFAEAHPQVDYSVFSIATPMVGTRLMKQVLKSGQLDDSDKINRVIKRTVALYETDAFSAYELGVIRAFDWDRINFNKPARVTKYAAMVGVSEVELQRLRDHSKQTFYRFFPDYDGPLSFSELYNQPGLFKEAQPVIPKTLY